MAYFDFEKTGICSKTENELKSESFIKIKDGDVSEYKLSLDFGKDVYPTVYSLIWEENQVDMMGFWSSKGYFEKHITADWYMRNEVSRTATGMPVISIFNKGNENRITIALSDPANATVLSAGVVEEKGNLRFKIDFFPDISPLMSKYEVIVRIDRRKVPFYQSLKDTKSWWSELGFKNCHIPESTRLPTYSAWYSYHQEIDVEAIIEECRHAKELSMDTIIIDDGWQTDDSSRGYAYCGDWKISKKKIPDMKYFVDSIHKLGMKFVIWFSVPYMGFKSENFERFKDMCLKKREHIGASVLDPRYKEVRDFLVDIYTGYVKEYGWDGLKLDFIDSFSPDKTSSTDYEKMDCVSVEEGVSKLLSEVAMSLKKINPEFMIEFRQSYVGPIMAQHGNFFRVTDCPGDPMMNRIGCLNLRLMLGGASVHSDMLMWNKNDTPEGVGYQLLACMFGVPQISVRFNDISEEQKRLLKYFLSFWKEHRSAILDGDLEVFDVEANYSMAKSKKDGECVAVLYQSVVYKADGDCVSYVFNSSGKSGVYVESDKEASYEIYSIYGEKQSEGKIGAGVSKLDVDKCGMVKII